MMARSNTAAKAAPNFQEWWSAVIEELLAAAPEQQIEALKALDQTLDHRLDLIAEERRPKGELKTDAVGQPATVGGIPVGFIRLQLDAGGHGANNAAAYIAALTP